MFLDGFLSVLHRSNLLSGRSFMCDVDWWAVGVAVWGGSVSGGGVSVPLGVGRGRWAGGPAPCSAQHLAAV